MPRRWRSSRSSAVCSRSSASARSPVRAMAVAISQLPRSAHSRSSSTPTGSRSRSPRIARSPSGAGSHRTFSFANPRRSSRAKGFPGTSGKPPPPLARLRLASPALRGAAIKGGASVSADVEELVREGLDRLAAVTEVPAGLADAALRRALHERLSGQWLAAPPTVTLIVGLWGVTARPYWGDEIDTVSAVSRSLPQLGRLLGHVDAVHGLYYLLLWPVARVAGTGELALRLPSVTTMATAAFGVAVIGRTLRSARAGVCAGLVFAALPIVTQQAHDARPYAMVTAAAVLASYLLLRAVADPRPARWAGYGLALVLVGYLELLALVLVAAHAVTLAVLSWQQSPPARGWAGPGGPGGVPGRRLAGRWLVTATATAAAAAPVVFWGWRQRGEIGWIRQPGWPDLRYLACWLAAGSATSAVLVGALAVLGARRRDSPGRAGQPAHTGPRRPLRALTPSLSVSAPGRTARALTWLALPWLVVPPLALIAVSQITPVYSFRYVVFCLP